MKILCQLRIFFKNIKKIYKRKIFEANATIGNNFECAAEAGCTNYSGNKSHIKIGNNCSLHAILSVDETGEIEIGDYTTIRSDTRVYAAESIRIGHHVIISDHVWICDNNNHPTSCDERIALCESGFESELWAWKYSDKSKIVIEDNVWIGRASTILKGVTIGKGSIVATRAVVTKDVPPYSIVAGNPARVVKNLLDENGV